MKGVSELVSAVVLIAIVLSAMLLFTYLFSTSHTAQIISIRDLLMNRKNRENELLSILHTSYYNGVVNISVYDYGDSIIHVSKIFVGNREVSYKIYDGYNDALVDAIYPRRPYVISISMSISSETTVVILTESGNIYSVKVST